MCDHTRIKYNFIYEKILLYDPNQGKSKRKSFVVQTFPKKAKTDVEGLQRILLKMVTQ